MQQNTLFLHQKSKYFLGREPAPPLTLSPWRGDIPKVPPLQLDPDYATGLPNIWQYYKAKKYILGHIWPHRDLDPWPFDHKISRIHSCSKIRQWWKFGKISSTNTNDILLSC